MTRIAINGMGRIGRLALRAIFDRDLQGKLEIVAVNEISGGPVATAHLLVRDTLKGKWSHTCKAGEDGKSIVVDGKHKIAFTDSKEISKLGWETLGVEVVLECTGKFTKVELLKPYFALGIKKVVVSAPVKEAGVLNIVYGVNDEKYDPAAHDIVTAASCTTNCLAPIVKVIHDNLKIVHGSLTTIHCVTNTQVIVDAPHKDLRRARSCLTSLVPTSTGSATAIAEIFPELRGKLNGLAVRVPLLNASITDACFEVSRLTTKEEVNAMFRDVSDKDTPLGRVLGYTEEELVGEDFRCDNRSGIVDATSTLVIDGTQVKIIAWYDNEQGYAYRMVDVVVMVAEKLGKK